MKKRLVVITFMIGNVFTVGYDDLPIGDFQIEQVDLRTLLAVREKKEEHKTKE
jgi:hypothetical protein